MELFRFTDEELAAGIRWPKRIAMVAVPIGVLVAIYAVVTEGLWGLLGFAILAAAFGTIIAIPLWGGRRASRYVMGIYEGNLVLPHNQARRVPLTDIESMVVTHQSIANPNHPYRSRRMDVVRIELRSGEVIEEIPGGNVQMTPEHRAEFVQRLQSVGINASMLVSERYA